MHRVMCQSYRTLFDRSITHEEAGMVTDVRLRAPREAVARPATMSDPGPRGRFGDHGGRYVPESLVAACGQVEEAFRAAWADPAFRAALAALLAEHVGRPTPLTRARRLS